MLENSKEALDLYVFCRCFTVAIAGFNHKWLP